MTPSCAREGAEDSSFSLSAFTPLLCDLPRPRWATRVRGERLSVGSSGELSFRRLSHTLR